MNFDVTRYDENIVHVDDKPSFSDHISKDFIHHALESSWGIA